MVRDVASLLASLAMALGMFCFYSCIQRLHSDDQDSVFARNFKEPPIVRVLLLEDVDSFELEIESPYNVYELEEKRKIAKGTRPLPKTSINAAKDVIRFGKTGMLKDDRIRIAPHKDGTVKVNNRRYRGAIHVVVAKDQKLLVINEVDMESYLMGVVGCEMSPSYPSASLDAQAIIARTYALYQIEAERKARKKLYFDLYADQRSQVYGGMSAESPRVTEAVQRTRGLVLSYEDDIFPTYYHSTCGGSTESANLIFGVKDILPLGSRECPYCKESKFYTWQFRMKNEELQKILKAGKVEVEEIRRIVPSKLSPRGHVLEVEIIHGKRSGREKKETVKGTDFRMMIGPDKLRSTRFEVKEIGNEIEFSGRGWGHGVGLCQVGAKKMGSLKFKTSEILRFYYPASELRRLY